MNTGAYCLIAELETDQNIRIGRWPAVRFPAGFYVYVGSAMNNLDRRIARHQSSIKRKHWHIDWFLEKAGLVEVKRIESRVRLECEISRLLEKFSEKTVRPGFGSSDCSCSTHLHYFHYNPSRLIDDLLYELLKK